MYIYIYTLTKINYILLNTFQKTIKLLIDGNGLKLILKYLVFIFKNY